MYICVYIYTLYIYIHIYMIASVFGSLFASGFWLFFFGVAAAAVATASLRGSGAQAGWYGGRFPCELHGELVCGDRVEEASVETSDHVVLRAAHLSSALASRGFAGVICEGAAAALGLRGCLRKQTSTNCSLAEVAMSARARCRRSAFRATPFTLTMMSPGLIILVTEQVVLCRSAAPPAMISVTMRPWSSTSRVVPNRVVSTGPLYPSEATVIKIVVFFWVRHPCILNVSGAGFATSSQIWLLGTTPFDTTRLIHFICLFIYPEHHRRLNN